MGKRIGGIIPALITPYRGDGSLNTDAVGRLVERLLGEGAAGFYVAGSTGECFLLSLEERKRLLEAAAEANRGRGLLIAHVGAIATDHAVELGRHACTLGADAVSSVPPFYYKFSLAEIKAYYRDVMDAIGCPMLVYNFPAFSGVTLSRDNAADLLADPRLAGVKHTSSDFYQLERIRQGFPRLALLNGYDEMFLAGLSMGAHGAIGSTFNFMARRFVRIQKLHGEGRAADALAVQAEVNEVIAVLVEVGVYPGVKRALRLQGLDVGDCRRPFTPLGPEQEQKLARALERLG